MAAVVTPAFAAGTGADPAPGAAAGAVADRSGPAGRAPGRRRGAAGPLRGSAPGAQQFDARLLREAHPAGELGDAGELLGAE